MFCSVKLWSLFLVSLVLYRPCQAQDHPQSTTCLGDLARSAGGGNDSSAVRSCSPGEFIEIEFKLYFGCDVPTFLDQGVRFEVDNVDWAPVRFYTPTLVPASGSDPLVHLLENGSVSAETIGYISALPLTLINASEVVTVREYLCGDYVALLKNQELRLRWMQRYKSNRNINVATWYLDNINVRLWNGECFLTVLSEDFSGELDDNFRIQRGTVTDVPCREEEEEGVLYFTGVRTMEESIVNRRSLVLNLFDIDNAEFESCDGVSDRVDMGLEGTCPVVQGSRTLSNVTIRCSQGDVLCGCGQLGIAEEGVVCEEELVTTTEATPTTTEATPTTTEATPTTTEATPTTTEDTPTTTEDTPTTTEDTPTTTEAPLITLQSVLDVIADVNLLENEDVILYLIDMFNGGSAPREVSEKLIAAADGVLQAIAMEGAGDSDKGGRVLSLLDDFALRAFNSSDNMGKIATERYSLSVKDVDADELSLTSSQSAISEEEGSISLPNTLFAELAVNSSEIRVASFLFKNISGVLPSAIDDGRNGAMVSSVVSTTLGCGEEECGTDYLKLKDKVQIKLQHFSGLEVPEDYEFSCLFFDLEMGVWSSRGCEKDEVLSNSSFTVCECDHLTHFAILLSPGLNITGAHQLSLEIIGYVGVAISVLSMMCTIFIFIFLKSMWGMRTYIHINLCVCLSVSQLLFVIAVDKTSIPELCQTIAVVLHYLFLASFMWMLMEGVVLYVVLVRVFIKKQSFYIIIFTIISYGGPALYMCLVVPLGLALRDDQGRPHYGSSDESDTCWLRYDTHFIWAFIAPVIVIIMINIGFFIMAVFIMCKHDKKGARKSQLEYMNRWLKTSISLLVVMGITWAIGVLVFHQALLFVAYIFTIATAFQGTIIFIIFVIFSKQVKEGYNSWWKAKRSESKILSSVFPAERKSMKLSRRSTFSTSRGTFRSTFSKEEFADIKLDKVVSQVESQQHEHLPTANGHTPIPNGHTTHASLSRGRHMSPVSEVDLQEVKISDKQLEKDEEVKTSDSESQQENGKPQIEEEIQQESRKPQIEDEDSSYFEVLMVNT